MVATQAERRAVTALRGGGTSEAYVVPLNAGIPINLYLDLLAGVQWALSQRRALVPARTETLNWGVLSDFLGALCLDSYVAPAESKVFFETRFMEDFKLEYISDVEGVQGFKAQRQDQDARTSSGGYFGPALDRSRPSTLPLLT